MRCFSTTSAYFEVVKAFSYQEKKNYDASMPKLLAKAVDKFKNLSKAKHKVESSVSK